MELCKFILFFSQMEILIFETSLKIEAKFQVTLFQSAVLTILKRLLLIWLKYLNEW